MLKSLFKHLTTYQQITGLVEHDIFNNIEKYLAISRFIFKKICVSKRTQVQMFKVDVNNVILFTQ